jgi:subtilisin family serine protease
VLTVYRIPAGTDLPTLVQSVTEQWPNAFAEPNRRYLPLAEAGQGFAQEAVLYAAALVALPAQGCGSAVRIAMLDGPLNVAAFPGRSIQTIDIAERSAEPRYDHASAIAGLWLAGDVARGVLPNAQLFAANVFGEDEKGRPFTSTEWILRGLDWVLGLPEVPPVVNLSFGGPDSAVLARAIERMQESTRVIAAGGNDGKPESVFPAAFPGVVGVTAVDARRKRWSRANTGEHIAIAAPGVDLWTIDGAGRGYYASGTSYASAFVTAALALNTPQQVELDAWLQKHTADLGTAGRDAQFGFGLLQAGGLCE